MQSLSNALAQFMRTLAEEGPRGPRMLDLFSIHVGRNDSFHLFASACRVAEEYRYAREKLESQGLTPQMAASLSKAIYLMGTLPVDPATVDAFLESHRDQQIVVDIVKIATNRT